MNRGEPGLKSPQFIAVPTCCPVEAFRLFLRETKFRTAALWVSLRRHSHHPRRESNCSYLEQLLTTICRLVLSPQAGVVLVLRVRVAGQCVCMSSAVQSRAPGPAPPCSPNGMIRAREDFQWCLQSPHAIHVNTREQPIRERGDGVIGRSQNGSP